MNKYIDKEIYRNYKQAGYKWWKIAVIILVYLGILGATIYYYNKSVTRNYELIIAFLIFTVFYYRLGMMIIDIKNVIIV
jgi:hypothetical protein